jgi:hypothetical protein
VSADRPLLKTACAILLQSPPWDRAHSEWVIGAETLTAMLAEDGTARISAFGIGAVLGLPVVVVDEPGIALRRRMTGRHERRDA